MNIYAAISNVMSEIGAITKDKKNQQQGFMYRGVDDVMNALQPILIKYKVFIVPETLEQTREEKTSKAGSALIYSICKIKYTFYADDGSNIIAVVIGEGMDSGDKATNKAMAIAFKYVCFQVFCIPTEEMKDPDAETPEIKPRQSKPASVQGKPEPQQGSEPDAGANQKASRGQVAEIFKSGTERKANFPDFDIFKLLEELMQKGSISTKYPYADKEKTRINWTQADVLAINEELELPFK
jgi:hypothetical protein